MTAPWRLTIGRLSIEWGVAPHLAGLDERPAPAAPPPDPLLLTVSAEAVAAQLAEGAHVLLDARPRRSAAHGTPPTQDAAWRDRVDVWMRELGG